jgi:mRNA interferase RelE/StbE
MACYKIIWKNSAKKELKKIDKKEIPNILNQVEKLSLEPFPKNHKKLIATEHIYRIRVGNYRVIYSIEDDRLVIEIIRVRHRKEVYKNL